MELPGELVTHKSVQLIVSQKILISNYSNYSTTDLSLFLGSGLIVDLINQFFGYSFKFHSNQSLKKITLSMSMFNKFFSVPV